jgi:hypothetical protein
MTLPDGLYLLQASGVVKVNTIGTVTFTCRLFHLTAAMDAVNGPVAMTAQADAALSPGVFTINLLTIASVNGDVHFSCSSGTESFLTLQNSSLTAVQIGP